MRPYPWGLSEDGETITLRRIDEPALAAPAPTVGTRLCIVDVETTGLDPYRDEVIQLACLSVLADPMRGVLYRAPHPHDGQWMRDPGREIPEVVTELTGIAASDVVGQTVPDDALRPMLDADLIVAHNALFDRTLCLRAWPRLRGKLWVCSMRQIDWAAWGHRVVQLEMLARMHGCFYGAHTALSDCNALAHLLSLSPRPGERTYAGQLLDRASMTHYLVSAKWAPFEMKEDLRLHGYRWNAQAKLWQLLCTEPELADALVTLEALYSKWKAKAAPGPLHAKVPLESLWDVVR